MGLNPEDIGGIDIGNPAGWLAGAFAQGLTRAEAVGMLRDAGFRIANDVLNRAIGEVRASMANALELQSVDKGALLNDEFFTRRQTMREGLYRYDFNMLVHDRDTGEVRTHHYTVLADQAISPDEAEAEALAVWGDHADDYNERLMGSVFTGASLGTGR